MQQRLKLRVEITRYPHIQQGQTQVSYLVDFCSAKEPEIFRGAEGNHLYFGTLIGPESTAKWLEKQLEVFYHDFLTDNCPLVHESNESTEIYE